MKNNKKKVILLGSGGHARVVLDTMLLLGWELIGITDFDNTTHGNKLFGIPVIGNDSKIDEFSPGEVRLANGVGSVGHPLRRNELYKTWSDKGFRFASVVHPSAVIGKDVELRDGVQVMAGAVIQTGCYIGENSIVNTSASIDHDCHLDKNCHISPGVILSGEVTIGSGSHVGTGACIVQGIRIGKGVLVAAGSVVTSDIKDNQSVRGVPAKPFKRRNVSA